MRKKILLLALAVMIGLTSLAEPLFAAAAEPTAQAVVTPADPVKKGDDVEWSYVYFGSYPQTQVLEEDVTEAIRNAAYDENGDAAVDGIKYRRVSWYKDGEISYDDMDSIFNNELGLDYWGDGEYLYFKWEPIKWRVLKNDGNTLFVITDRVIKEQWNENRSVTWEDSTTRKFLNDTFYNQAFNELEQEAIVEQTVNNQEYNLGNDTLDKVYLPVASDVDGKMMYRGELDSTMHPTEYSFATGSRIILPHYAGGGEVAEWAFRTDIKSKYASGGMVPVLHIDIHSDQWKLVEDSGPAKLEKLQIFAKEKKVGAGTYFSVYLRTFPFATVTAKKNIEWSVSDPEYAVVTGTSKGYECAGFRGSVYAKKGGKTVTITARATDGSGVEAKIKVKIMKHRVTEVKFKNKQNLPKKLAVGETMKLKAEVITTGKKAYTDLYWESSLPWYADVDQEGNVTVLSAPEVKTNPLEIPMVTISAEAQDGSDEYALFTFEAMKNKVTGVSFKNPEEKLAAGQTKKLKAKVTTDGEDAYTDLSWKSSDPKYATVDQKGNVTALKAGKGKTVTITATSKDGTKEKAKVEVKIMKHEVTGVSFKNPPKKLAVGQTKKLKTKVTTSGKKAYTDLSWKSSNPKYATVDQNGKVTALEAGKGKKVTITATAKDGTGKKAKVKIKIK